jgi:hypothetical protein
MNQLATFFTGLKVGEAQTYGNLKVYPLHRQNGHPRKYRTLDEAMNAKEAVVKEASEGGNVPTLVVQNTGKLPVLIVVGEELIGAKQNRVLNTSLLVPAESELPIPVSCVERGRWRYTSRFFESSPTSSHASLRMMQTEKVTENLRTRNAYDADQGAVWGEVQRKMGTHQMVSTTAALHDVYTGMTEKLTGYLDALKTPEAEGILVAINGSIVGADVFDHAETLRNLWGKLVRSYALDALEREGGAQATTDDPQQFLSAVENASEETYESVGLGNDVRLTSERIAGSGLLWEDQLVHASVFNKRK